MRNSRQGTNLFSARSNDNYLADFLLLLTAILSIAIASHGLISFKMTYTVKRVHKGQNVAYSQWLTFIQRVNIAGFLNILPYLTASPELCLAVLYHVHL